MNAVVSRLNRRELILLISACLIAEGMAVYGLFVQPAALRLQRAESALASARQALADAPPVPVAAPIGALPSLFEVKPGESPTLAIQRYVDAEVQSCQISPLSLTVNPHSDLKNVYVVSLQVNGTYDEVAAYLDRVAQPARALELQQCTLQTDQRAPDHVIADIRLAVYMTGWTGPKPNPA